MRLTDKRGSMVIYKNVVDTIYEFAVKVSGDKVILVADFIS